MTVLEQVMSDMPAEYREVNEYEAKSMLNKLGISDFTAKKAIFAKDLQNSNHPYKNVSEIYHQPRGSIEVWPCLSA